MVSNALMFNAHGSNLWDEARRYYELCMHKVFVTYGKAAPPGRYHAAVHRAFEDAKRAREMEAERVRLDETTEKKDLVIGAHVEAVELSPLAKPSDPESIVPIADVWMSPVDAFYCAWMECCFACRSSGASDTMLFCVDCGESYHSFCADVPVRSMTDWAVAGWRCPNCKICEIIGDVPEDENDMLICEMCDRAFTMSELSPPLKSVPSGLFICGQCVDCKSCNNKSEKGEISRRYWSRDPHKCFRCGGCKGLVERQTKGMKCAVCSCLWRSGDTDLVACVRCKRNIHAHCYGETVQGQKKESYECPLCRKKDDEKRSAAQLRNNLYKQARQVLTTCHQIRGSSLDECHSKLFDEIDWQMRSARIGEYRTIVADGERLLGKAKEKYGRNLRDMFAFDGKGPHAPVWMVQRASRWIRYKEKRKGSVETEEKHGTRAVVLRAKMAAAFIQIACWSMGTTLRKAVRNTDRLKSLLVAPSEDDGIMLLPAEKIKLAGSQIIQENEWATKYFDKDTFDSLIAKEKSTAKPSCDAASANTSTSDSRNEILKIPAIIGTPLLGWGRIDKSLQETHPWKDPRSCCLCGGCGDDDAGVISGKSPDQTEGDDSGIQLAHAGRLLPMQQGLWVHAACALWSSEVWENPEDGLLYALEKARYRGSKLKCFGCGRPGATIGCQKQNCSSNFHFPCAKACGAVFTKHQQMFCKNHKPSAEDMTEIDNYEVMKPLKAACEQVIEDSENTLCYRAGSLVVHSIGKVRDDFHSEQHITPFGYIATRIFWSFSNPRTRTLYFLKVECCENDKQLSVFSITAADAPGTPIKGHTVMEAYNLLIRRVEQANATMFSEGDMFSSKPVKRGRRKHVFGLNGPQFFGFGLTQVRKKLETLPGIAAVAVPLSPSTQPYLFCFKHPKEEEIKDLQRERAVKAAEKALENVSGCARTEGMCAVARSGGSGRITRALVKRAEEDKSSSLSGSTGKGRNNLSESVDSNIQEKYREMKSVPIKDRLEAKRSHIHGWGLFTKNSLPKHAMIVEYMGETIRQRVADKRERAYETSGVGSCYMFRLDQTRIVDATMIGCMARFMNHCCQPNAYAKVISVNTDLGIEKKIVVFANREIGAGDEITYDYKFPVEDGSLRCTCGAPNCIGRMN
uniref:Histone-lysine N-methyltransferase n=2 Tax=Odontella aurita TaxID=265563 RepID=A0A7S4J2A5_9STRA|mmetsp:Transcript_36049/g.107797  ORF Transcript_36049/g.107797 Transcript_36049/m.107797 type:complete len:1138 (+) Transcript_36049:122-3535(+)